MIRTYPSSFPFPSFPFLRFFQLPSSSSFRSDILFQIYDWNKIESHVLLGHLRLPLHRLLSAPNGLLEGSFPLDKEITKKNKSQVPTNAYIIDIGDEGKMGR